MFIVDHFNGHGELLKTTEYDSVNEITDDYHSDYWVQIGEACDVAMRQVEPVEIILGPPLLAGAVDRIQIRLKRKD